MEYLAETTHLLYTQLLSQCLRGAAPDGRGISFVHKTIKNSKHWYLQLNIGSKKTQHYLGPDSKDIQILINKEKALWQKSEPDRKQRETLVSMLVAGGAHTVSSAEARVFELLEQAGVFLANGVLVGSHAFAIYSNMLGVQWPSQAIRTQDIDIASDDHISVGILNNSIDLRQILMESDMSFIEIPALNRKSPSTSFAIQGKQLSVDILTPMTGKPVEQPVYIRSLKTYAQPLRFLDYLLEDTQSAVIVARAGILANVPTPARYALHKLVTATRRPAAMQTKNIKDLEQAAQLLIILLEDRPGDLHIAFEAAKQQPIKFITQLKLGINQLPKQIGKKISNHLDSA